MTFTEKANEVIKYHCNYNGTEMRSVDKILLELTEVLDKYEFSSNGDPECIASMFRKIVDGVKYKNLELDNADHWKEIGNNVYVNIFNTTVRKDGIDGRPYFVSPISTLDSDMNHINPEKIKTSRGIIDRFYIKKPFNTGRLFKQVCLVKEVDVDGEKIYEITDGENIEQLKKYYDLRFQS